MPLSPGPRERGCSCGSVLLAAPSLCTVPPRVPLQVGADIQPGRAGGPRPRQTPVPGVRCGGGQAVLSLQE